MKKFRANKATGYIWAAVLAAVILLLYVILNPPTDYEAEPAAMEISAEDLYYKFADYAHEAGDRFEGQMIEITGSVSSVEQIQDLVVVTFSFEEGFFGREGVRCNMLENHREKALELSPGQNVRLKGLCTGFSGSDVILEYCSFPEESKNGMR